MIGPEPETIARLIAAAGIFTSAVIVMAIIGWILNFKCGE